MKKYNNEMLMSTRETALNMYKALPGSKLYATVHEICATLGISRTMLYLWLKSAGISTVRKTRADKFIANPGPVQLMAVERGVSYPTARKYVRIKSKMITQGFLTYKDLHDYGYTFNKIASIRAELGMLGIELNIERQYIKSKKGICMLDVFEILEILSNPRKFLFVNAADIIARWE